jgi:hypothetical protein
VRVFTSDNPDDVLAKQIKLELPSTSVSRRLSSPAPGVSPL